MSSIDAEGIRCAPDGRSRGLPFRRLIPRRPKSEITRQTEPPRTGTEDSNPVPSSAESVANPVEPDEEMLFAKHRLDKVVSRRRKAGPALTGRTRTRSNLIGKKVDSGPSDPFCRF